MTRGTLSQGRLAEDYALEYLLAQGLEYVTRNYRCRAGEIDLILTQGLELVVAEVRLRSTDQFGDAAESVTAAKRRRIIDATRHFTVTREEFRDAPIRFDVIAVSRKKERLLAEWIQDAFQAESWRYR